MTDWSQGIPVEVTAGAVDFHGGPLDGQQIWYPMDTLRRLRRVRVPVLDDGRASFGAISCGIPWIGVFLYAISLERWPIPPEGPRWIGYPAP